MINETPAGSYHGDRNMTTPTRLRPLAIVAAGGATRGFSCGDILEEIETKLAALVATGEDSAVDLGRHPMPATEYRQLWFALAPGRVSAMGAAPQHCEVRETNYPGVWWVTRYDRREEVGPEGIEVGFASEVIEIGLVPSILRCSPEDANRALRCFRAVVRDGDTPQTRCVGGACG